MYTLNKNYVPKEGDYLSSEDWTDDQIKWLASNTPESWWYCSRNIKQEGFGRYLYLEIYCGEFHATSYLEGNNARITPDMILIEEVEFTPPLLQPSPRSKKVLVADLSNDTMGALTDRLTHGKVYSKISKPSGRSVEILCDDGVQRAIGSCWFKKVYLYDEDETELTCRDIEFKEETYIDLRKHTPEQIRHIAKFYKFFDVELLLSKTFWYRIYWDNADGFVGTIRDTDELGKEYTYDDIFYKEY